MEHMTHIEQSFIFSTLNKYKTAMAAFFVAKLNRFHTHYNLDEIGMQSLQIDYAGLSPYSKAQ